MTNNEQRTPNDEPNQWPASMAGEPWPDSNSEAILRLNGRIGSLKEDISALSDRLNAWKAIQGDIHDRLKAVEKRLDALQKATPPTDPYEAEIAQAIAKQSLKRSPSPKAIACARLLLRNWGFEPLHHRIDDIAKTIERFFDSSDYGRTHSGPQDGDPDA